MEGRRARWRGVRNSALCNALRQIMLQTARCREVTHKLLIFGGRTEGTVRDVDLSTLIADTLTLRRRDAAQKNVEVEEETAPMPRIHTEPSLLRQILLQSSFLCLLPDANDSRSRRMQIQGRDDKKT